MKNNEIGYVYVGIDPSAEKDKSIFTVGVGDMRYHFLEEDADALNALMLKYECQLEDSEKLVELVKWYASLKTVEDIQKDIDRMEGLPCPTMEQTLKAVHNMCIKKAQEALNKTKGS